MVYRTKDVAQGRNVVPQQPASTGSARGFRKADCFLVREIDLSAELGRRAASSRPDTTGTASDQPMGGALA